MELEVLTRFEATCVAPLFATPEQLRALALLVSEKAALLDAHGQPLEAACEWDYAARLEEESRKRFRTRDVLAAARLNTALAEALSQHMRVAPTAAPSPAEGG
jgi:hypothetical protein